MRRIAAFIVTALFFGVASLYTAFANADNAAGVASAKPAGKTAAIPLRGTLYRVDYRGHTCYLFGTVHVGQAAFYPLEPQVTRALHEASKLVLEIDIRDTAAFQQAILKHGIYPGGQTIETHLPADDLARLKRALNDAGIPFDQVARMKPWMIANLLIVQSMARNGFPVEQGIELYFLSIAEKEKKTVQELESAAYQLSLFDQLNEIQQREYLRETLHDLADGSAIEKSAALIDAWSHADSNKMAALKQEILNDASASSRFIEDVLLNQRNPGMTDKIEILLAHDKSTFVAIGALHLIGDGSVPALLRQRGYQVKKLY